MLPCGAAQPAARVFAAFLAAAERPAAPLVFAALRADADFEAALRLDAASFACVDSADLEAARCPSFFNAFVVAFERVADGLERLCEADSSAAACWRVDLLADFLTGTFTPSRRALDRPMAIACFVDLAPCLPPRICSISS